MSQNLFKQTLNRPKFNSVIALSALMMISACNLMPGSSQQQQPQASGYQGPEVDITQPVKVAMLVPNGGSNATLNEIGNSLANAGQIANKDYNRGEIDLMVYSTGGDFSTASALAQQAQAEGAKLIVGPLTSEEAAAVANVTNLPILSFSNNSTIADGNTFILGTTFQSIADRVVGFQKSQGGKSIGVVYPDDIGGQQGSNATVAAASNNNVDVVTRQPYRLSQADINAAAPSIASNLKSSGANMVMLTDHPSAGLSMIASGLRDAGFTNQDATFLGLARWNENAQGLTEAGLAGGIFAAPDPVRTSKFENRYQSEYGSRPHNLGGLGFDGIVAAISMVRQARSKNDTTPFSAEDLNRVTFGGANGAVQFRGNMAQRGLAVMQLNAGSVAIVSPAPNNF